MHKAGGSRPLSAAPPCRPGHRQGALLSPGRPEELGVLRHTTVQACHVRFGSGLKQTKFRCAQARQTKKSSCLNNRCHAMWAVLEYLRHLYRAVRDDTGPAEVLHVSQAEYPTKPKITLNTHLQQWHLNSAALTSVIADGELVKTPKRAREGSLDTSHGCTPSHKVPQPAAPSSTPTPCPQQWQPASPNPPSSASPHLRQRWRASGVPAASLTS